MTGSASAAYARAANFELVEAGDHVGVVLLHGLGGDLNQPRDYTSGMVGDRPASRLAADARLHGGSRLSDQRTLTFDVMADDILALADAVRLPPDRIWVGVSMGAATALRVALRSRSGIRGLVLIRPAWLNQPYPPNLRPLGLVAELMIRYGAADGRRRFAEHPLWQSIHAESPSGAASLLDQFDKPSAADRVRRLVEIPASTPFREFDELTRLDVPALVIGAPRDPLHPLGIAEQWADRLPNARYLRISSRDDDPLRHVSDLRRGVDDFVASL
jgi:pimeloyl-ACP methyl ester carboxylesterase